MYVGSSVPASIFAIIDWLMFACFANCCCVRFSCFLIFFSWCMSNTIFQKKLSLLINIPIGIFFTLNYSIFLISSSSEFFV